MTYRDYDAARDLESLQRIWKECGWVDDDKEAAVLEGFFSVGDAMVATIDDEAECAVLGTPGTMRYLEEDLSLAAVTAVTTSRIARKSGFALKLTARLLAKQAGQGHEIAALGMFDQGYYNRLGFGTGSYEHWFTFDPATLTVENPFRPPKRLSKDDFEKIHGAMVNRAKGHGACDLHPLPWMKAELSWVENPFGYGYFDGANGELTHFIFGSAKGEHGPYTIGMRAYQTREQLLELLALVKSFGDQVNSIGLIEFGEIQLQDLLKQPFRNRRSTAKSVHQNSSIAHAYWQLRILDLKSCLAKTHLNTPTVQFNLNLTDPVADSLDPGSNWRGIAGDYIIAIGPESTADPGTNLKLPTLNATVNAFSRLWFGIRPASSLAVTDELTGPPELLKSLDDSLRLPNAHLGWDF